MQDCTDGGNLCDRMPEFVQFQHSDRQLTVFLFGILFAKTD